MTSKFRISACRTRFSDQPTGWWVDTPEGVRFWRRSWVEALQFLDECVQLRRQLEGVR